MKKFEKSSIDTISLSEGFSRSLSTFQGLVSEPDYSKGLVLGD